MSETRQKTEGRNAPSGTWKDPIGGLAARAPIVVVILTAGLVGCVLSGSDNVNYSELLRNFSVLMAGCALTAVVEEVLFRGLLMNALLHAGDRVMFHVKHRGKNDEPYDDDGLGAEAGARMFHVKHSKRREDLSESLEMRRAAGTVALVAVVGSAMVFAVLHIVPAAGEPWPWEMALEAEVAAESRGTMGVKGAPEIGGVVGAVTKPEAASAPGVGGAAGVGGAVGDEAAAETGGAPGVAVASETASAPPEVGRALEYGAARAVANGLEVERTPEVAGRSGAGRAPVIAPAVGVGNVPEAARTLEAGDALKTAGAPEAGRAPVIASAPETGGAVGVAVAAGLKVMQALFFGIAMAGLRLASLSRTRCSGASASGAMEGVANLVRLDGLAVPVGVHLGFDLLYFAPVVLATGAFPLTYISTTPAEWAPAVASTVVLLWPAAWALGIARRGVLPYDDDQDRRRS